PPDGRQLFLRDEVRKSPNEIGAAKRSDVPGEQRNDKEGRFGKIEEAEQEADDQPGQERRAHTAVVESPEQRGEGQKFNAYDRRPLQIARPLVEERQCPEQPYTDYHSPAGKPRIRIGQIQEHTDRLREQRPGEMRKYEISCEIQLRTFRLYHIGDKPVDYQE